MRQLLNVRDLGAFQRFVSLCAGYILPVEIKSGSTLASDWFSGLVKWGDLAGDVTETPWLVYGGEQRQRRGTVEVLPWRQIGALAEIV